MGRARLRRGRTRWFATASAAAVMTVALVAGCAAPKPSDADGLTMRVVPAQSTDSSTEYIGVLIEPDPTDGATSPPEAPTTTSADRDAVLAAGVSVELPERVLPVTPSWLPAGFLGPYWTDRDGVLAAAWMNPDGAALVVLVDDTLAPLTEVGVTRRLPVVSTRTVVGGRDAWWEYADPFGRSPDDLPGSTDVIQGPIDEHGYPAFGRLAVQLDNGVGLRLFELPSAYVTGTAGLPSADGPSEMLTNFATGLTDAPLTLPRSIGVSTLPAGMRVGSTVDGPTFGSGWPALALCTAELCDDTGPSGAGQQVIADGPGRPDSPESLLMTTDDTSTVTVVDLGDRSMTITDQADDGGGSGLSFATITTPEAVFSLSPTYGYSENGLPIGGLTRQQQIAVAAAVQMPADGRSSQRELVSPFERGATVHLDEPLVTPMEPVEPAELTLDARWWPASVPVTVSGRPLVSYEAYPDGGVVLYYDREQTLSISVAPDGRLPEGRPLLDGPAGAVQSESGTVEWRTDGHLLSAYAPTPAAARKLAVQARNEAFALPAIDLPAAEVDGWSPGWASWDGAGSGAPGISLTWCPAGHEDDSESGALVVSRGEAGGPFEADYNEDAEYVELPIAGHDDLPASIDTTLENVRARDAHDRPVDVKMWTLDLDTPVTPAVLASLLLAAVGS